MTSGPEKKFGRFTIIRKVGRSQYPLGARRFEKVAGSVDFDRYGVTQNDVQRVYPPEHLPCIALSEWGGTGWDARC